MEASWALRAFDGSNIKDCPPTFRVEKVRLCWSASQAEATQGELCAPSQWEEFDCTIRRGVTGFRVPAGPTFFTIEPVCSGDIALGVFQAPPPILRTVENGEVVTLNSLLIEIDEETCPESN